MITNTVNRDCEYINCCTIFSRDNHCTNRPPLKLSLSAIIDGTYNITNGKVNVEGNVCLIRQGLKIIPWMFRAVSGHFHIDENELTSLYGCPEHIGRDLYCNKNKLKSLKYCAKTIGENFCCGNNKLTSFNYCPEYIGGSFYGYNNPIESLVGLSFHIMMKIYHRNEYSILTERVCIPKELLGKFKKWLIKDTVKANKVLKESNLIKKG